MPRASIGITSGVGLGWDSLLTGSAFVRLPQQAARTDGGYHKHGRDSCSETIRNDFRYEHAPSVNAMTGAI